LIDVDDLVVDSLFFVGSVVHSKSLRQCLPERLDDVTSRGPHEIAVASHHVDRNELSARSERSVDLLGKPLQFDDVVQRGVAKDDIELAPR